MRVDQTHPITYNMSIESMKWNTSEREQRADELVISDSDHEKAISLLNGNKIAFNEREASQRVLLDNENKTYAAGECGIEIMDATARLSLQRLKLWTQPLKSYVRTG